MEVHRRIYEELITLADPAQKENLSRFFKTGPGEYGEGDMFLGIKVPQTRALAKSYWKSFSLADVEALLDSTYHEVRLCGLLILVQMYKHARKDNSLQKGIVDFYLSHSYGINNWDLVDLSCYEILGNWCLDNSDYRFILKGLAKEGSTIWEQRIGIVSTMALVRANEFQECMEISDILLHHQHDLIQKAVGWLLREVGKRDGKILREFLFPRYKHMPRTMLRYAIEKFPEEERQKYLKGEI